MNYTELIGTTTDTGSIKRWVNNSQIDVATIVTEAEQYIWRRLRIRQMIALSTGSMSTATAALTLPSTFLDDYQLMITGTEKLVLTRRLLEDVESMIEYDGTGVQVSDKPTEYAIDGSEAVFAVKPNSAYPYRWRYYQQLPALTTATATNVLTNRYPRMLRCACMAFANEFMKNSNETQRWLVLTEAEINTANRESEMEIGNAQIGADYGD